MARRRRKQPDPALFEKLGVFYLGRRHDLTSGDTTDDLVLYDAKDLTTHAVCVGMTGSGKTGLCISLLEEAALDGIPAIAIDPKGDLGNLLLTFPRLDRASFRPWIDEAAAAREGETPDAYADRTAALWKSGLAGWGQDGARIRRLRDAAECTIYTPGSDAGVPLAVLKSLTAPPSALLDDAEAFGQRVASAVSGLLALVGIDADPVQSREHILVSTLFGAAWRGGRSLDLATLVGEIQSPPVKRIGAMDLDTFFPPKDRLALAMRLNGLLASPSFATWLAGEPLDIPQLLWAPDGRPQVAIVSIAHLSEAERMFFVTLLLNEVVAWMRAQPGTTSLRALLYMDEVFGYFPPTANPPSKGPMLTLLKQARAYGLGVVLATQNPVDLDYKGLSNAGTWFLGRLQTERDKQRVIEGLEGASATAGGTFDRRQMDRLLAGLKSRVFLMKNVHEDAPELFHTRWAMSYLRGPLTRAHIKTLMADRVAKATRPAPVSTPETAPAATSPSRPAVPAVANEGFVGVATNTIAAPTQYHPALLGTADLHYANARMKLDVWETTSFLAPLGGDVGGQVWESAERLPDGAPEIETDPVPNARFAELPARAMNSKSYSTWGKAFKTYLYKECGLSVFRCPALKLHSTPGESESEFRIRAREAAREKRDLAVQKLRKRYTPKLERLVERIRRAEEKVGKERSQYGQQKLQTAVSIGATVLGALLGRKVASVGTVGRATTAARGVGRAAREREDIARAKRDLDSLERKLADLETDFEDELDELTSSDPSAAEITTQPVRPRKSDISVQTLRLIWLPHLAGTGGVSNATHR